MAETLLKITPDDHGRRMSLEEFDCAEASEGHLFELGRGVISVSDIPGKKHFKLVDALKQRFYLYKAANPEVIRMIGGGGECKILLTALDSERHPDVAVYKTDPPDGPDIWSVWIPEIVVEVVSPGSEKRDYEEKPAEYLAFGVMEYWIVDEAKGCVIINRRSAGSWSAQTLAPDAVYQTRLLPGFELNCATLFAAAKSA